MVDALRTIHRALTPGGLLIDTQPLSALPPAETEQGPLGALDMRAWAGTIAEVDERIGEAVALGLFAVEAERRFTVTDRYDDGPDFLDHVADWADTAVGEELAERARGTRSPVLLHQEVRLRLLRAR